jgi:hypothetical protein
MSYPKHEFESVIAWGRDKSALGRLNYFEARGAFDSLLEGFQAHGYAVVKVDGTPVAKPAPDVPAPVAAVA